MEVYCHDGVSRQCRIRGLLRKKGQVFIDIDSYVVVSLREATESSSEDETGLGTGAAIDDKTADIIGLFDDKQRVQLQKTQVNPRLFVTVGADGKEEQLDDMFDRSDLLEGMEDEAEEDSKLTKPKGRSQKGAVQTSMKEANVINDIDIDNI